MTKNQSEYLKLLSRHELRLIACVHALVPDMHHAEDLLQEVKLRLWEQFDEFEPGSDFGAWACTIARFMVLAHYKSQQRSRLRFSTETINLIADQFSRLPEADHRSDALVACLQQLTADARELLRRCYIDGQPIKQVAAETNQPLPGAYSAMSRIRRKLAACIEHRLAQEQQP